MQTLLESKSRDVRQWPLEVPDKDGRMAHNGRWQRASVTAAQTRLSWIMGVASLNTSPVVSTTGESAYNILPARAHKWLPEAKGTSRDQFQLGVIWYQTSLTLNR
jgi:hypothetical protein